MNPYTVVLLYPDYFTDTNGPHIAHIEADTHELAIAQAQDAAAKEYENSGANPPDYRLLIWFNGHLDADALSRERWIQQERDGPEMG